MIYLKLWWLLNAISLGWWPQCTAQFGRCSFVCLYVLVHVYVGLYVFMCLRLFMYMRVWVFMSVCVWVFICVCLCVWVCMSVRKYYVNLCEPLNAILLFVLYPAQFGYSCLIEITNLDIQVFFVFFINVLLFIFYWFFCELYK